MNFETAGQQFNCPSFTEEVKLKFGQTLHFDYAEKCPGDLSEQNALLG